MRQVLVQSRRIQPHLQAGLIIDGHFPERNVKGEVGGYTWMGVAMEPHPHPAGATNMFHGTSTIGGSAAVFGKKERAEGNRKLSRDRAEAVITALVNDYAIARARLEADGVGPLVPVFTNKKDAGRAKNRRVELVLK